MAKLKSYLAQSTMYWEKQVGCIFAGVLTLCIMGHSCFNQRGAFGSQNCNFYSHVNFEGHQLFLFKIPFDTHSHV